MNLTKSLGSLNFSNYCKIAVISVLVMLFDLLTLIFSIIEISYCYSEEFGDTGLKNCGKFFINVSVFCVISIGINSIVFFEEIMDYPIFFPYIVMQIMRIVLLVSVMDFVSAKHQDDIVSIIKANWHVDPVYMRYEFKNVCRGLSVFGDETDESTLCDEFLNEDVSKFLKNFKNFFYVSFVLSILSLVFNFVQTITTCICD